MTAPVAETSSRFEDFDVLDFTRKNQRILSIVGGAALIVVAGGWLWTASAKRKEAAAAQALAQARVAAESGNLPLAASDLARLAERFQGSRSADQAVILLNQVRLIQGQRDAAISALQEFVRERHPDYVLASAYALLGSALEDAGQLGQAAEAYRQAATMAELDFMKATYLLDAGRASVLAGDTAAAKASYRDLLTNYGRLEQSAEARVRMAEIGGEVPPMPKPETDN
jgi:tetratricopeptide (TPR) repeat protein